MVALVEEMLALHRRLAAARAEHERTILKPQMDAANRRISGRAITGGGFKVTILPSSRRKFL
jgi:hypothetical protein